MRNFNEILRKVAPLESGLESGLHPFSRKNYFERPQGGQINHSSLFKVKVFLSCDSIVYIFSLSFLKHGKAVYCFNGTITPTQKRVFRNIIICIGYKS